MDSDRPIEGPGHSIQILQAMRGIASMMVVLYHASRFISPYGTGLGWTLFGGGSAMGVEMFFVLSGFIMVYTTTRGESLTPKEFLLRRFLRIWPIYALITLAYIWIRGADRLNITTFVQSFTFIPLRNNEGPYLGVGWTLNFEMYFYLVFGLCLYAGRFRWAAFFAWIGLTLIALPLFKNRPIMLDGDAPYNFHAPYLNLVASPLIWLFAVGVVAGLLYRSRATFPTVFSAKLTVYMLACCVAWHYMSGWRIGHGMSQAGLFVAPLTVAVIVATKSVAFSVPRSLVYLGDISFSMYLLHPIIQEQLQAYFERHDLASTAQGFSFVFLTTAITIAASALSHRYLERRFTNVFRARLTQAKHLTA